MISKEQCLNQSLYNALSKEIVDYEHVKELLDKGADPLGPMLDIYETPLGEIFCEAGYEWDYSDVDDEYYDDENADEIIPSKIIQKIKLFPIMEFLISNGFDCTRFKSKRDDSDGNMELWCLKFSISEQICKSVKLMIENGLAVEPLEDFFDHFYIDSAFCDGSDLDEYYEEYLNWAFKTIMLCASYPHILNNSEYLRDSIEINTTNKDNSYDLLKFREYDNYEYKYDLSTQTNVPHGMQGTTVEIREKGSDDVIWTMHIE